MVVAIPGGLAVVLASVRLDVVEVKNQIIAAAVTASEVEQASLIETAAQLLALESAIQVVLRAQGELESSPGVKT
jgi:hypothetical protein